VYAQATTTVTIRRGTTTTDLGDTVDTDTTVVTGVAMSIVQRSRAVQVPATDRVQQLSWHEGRARADLDVRAGDILEAADGSRYTVQDVHTAASPITTTDRRIALHRIE
jgi:hypothetical protein